MRTSVVSRFQVCMYKIDPTRACQARVGEETKIKRRIVYSSGSSSAHARLYMCAKGCCDMLARRIAYIYPAAQHPIPRASKQASGLVIAGINECEAEVTENEAIAVDFLRRWGHLTLPYYNYHPYTHLISEILGTRRRERERGCFCHHHHHHRRARVKDGSCYQRLFTPV